MGRKRILLFRFDGRWQLRRRFTNPQAKVKSRVSVMKHAAKWLAQQSASAFCRKAGKPLTNDQRESKEQQDCLVRMGRLRTLGPQTHHVLRQGQARPRDPRYRAE